MGKYVVGLIYDVDKQWTYSTRSRASDFCYHYGQRDITTR